MRLRMHKVLEKNVADSWFITSLTQEECLSDDWGNMISGHVARERISSFYDPDFQFHIKRKDAWRMRVSRTIYRQYQAEKQEIVGDIIRKTLRERVHMRLLQDKHHTVSRLNKAYSDKFEPRVVKQLRIIDPELEEYASNIGYLDKYYQQNKKHFKQYADDPEGMMDDQVQKVFKTVEEKVLDERFPETRISTDLRNKALAAANPELFPDAKIHQDQLERHRKRLKHHFAQGPQYAGSQRTIDFSRSFELRP